MVSVEVCFDSYYNFQRLCLGDSPTQAYWLSWNFLDKTYKSDEFTRQSSGPSNLKNVVKFDLDPKENPNLIPSEVLRAFPFRVFFCTTEAILAVANVNPFSVESVDRENITSTMPFEISVWADFVPIDAGTVSPDYYEEGRGASIKVSLAILPERDEANEYEEEVFESEEAEYVTETVREESHTKHVRFPQVDRKKKEAQAKLEEEEEQDRLLRHYRLSVDMRSVGGFKRPAHVALHYIYPFLGTSAPVRTHPTWVMANTESRVDNGAACFECAMSREQLRTTLAEHPLKITALTRSHLGNNLLGELKVDLTAVMYTDPHSFRCPLTSKVFKTMKDYNRHRQVLLTLVAAGQVEQAPPREPVVIRALDSYLVFTAPSPESRAAAYAGSEGAAAADAAKATPNYIVPLAEGGKLRVVLILEDIGVVGNESAIRVKPGYKMHNGAVYDMYGQNTGVHGALSTADLHSMHMRGERGEGDADGDELVDSTMHKIAFDPLDRGTVEVGGESRPLTAIERKTLEKLKLEWEAWRRGVDTQWREALVEKETLLRKKLEEEAAAKLVERAEDLKRAQIEAGKLEVRLRSAIDEVQRQKAQLGLQEEQMQIRLAQKTAELQLLQRRVRDETKAEVSKETRRADALQQQYASLQDSYRQMEKRAKDAELDFEQYRAQLRKSPESVLREETARLRAQVGECRGEIERERRLRADTELEKEHFRAQMQRLALALKREREKSATIARQDLEQLRLEFLAREERYVLDGDREELRFIRNELASLRQGVGQQHQGAEESKGYSPPRGEASKAPSSVPADPQAAAVNLVRNLRSEIDELLSTGMYEAGSDPVILELQANLAAAEQRVARMQLRA